MSTTPVLISAESLQGDGVVNSLGDDLGKIETFMIDTTSGSIRYAVLSFGGFLGFGNKLFAVPWQALNLDSENKRFVFNVDKERLENAPGFDKDNWPNMSNPEFQTEVNAYYL